MRTMLLVIVGILAASDILGVDFGLAPGLSVKNAVLYLGFGVLLLQRAVTNTPRLQLVWLQAVFLLLILYAAGSVVLNIIVLEIPGFRLLPQIITLKTQLIDRFIVFLLFFYVARTEADVRTVLAVLLGAIALGCLFTVTNVMGLTSIGTTEYGHENEFEGGRIYGYFGHANETGTLLVTLIPACIMMVESARGWSRAAWLGAVAAMALMLLMTGSRGSMVGLLVGGGAVLLAYRRHLERKRVQRWVLLTVTVLVPVMLVVGWQFVQMLADRIAIQASGPMGHVSSGRTELWVDALEAMLESPWTALTGFGWGGWDNQNFSYVAHNNYLAYWFDLGLPGLIGLMCLLVGTMLVARRAVVVAQPGARGHLIAFIAGMASLLVALAFLNLYSPWAYIWAYIGLMMRYALIVGPRPQPAPAVIGNRSPGAPIAPPARSAAAFRRA